MAPTFFHYRPVPMDDQLKEEGQGPPKLLLLIGISVLLVVVVGLGVPLIIFALKANSKACQDGLRAEMEHRNVTHLLQHQLTRAQEGFLQAETRAATCNRTMVTLLVSLEEKTAQGLKQQAQVEKLQGEITKLNLRLQNTLEEVERLRREKEASGENQRSPSSAASSLTVAPALSLLGLRVLLL
ncbi:PREDICTED: bone marrow stromal antigen 2 [Galeopterus variegatus]|uniref:Bone marrow stromal antigen 2 n=1 Tax=Galeopterus variegatus TaxID=482537 RepID=A0ABM0RDU4_GALVR|nr:PREDICTED: bone marrow stromal antigen 2 [Galeopterus variegatus]XP_008578785.1 PREDICTED: bone marrow stromal antigen 2 [Galeopterus variegatus]